MIQPGTEDPLTTGWTFTQTGGTFSDNGTVSGKRQIAFASPATTTDTGEIEKTVTGLINGTTGFSVKFLETGSGVGSRTIKLFADGVLLDSEETSGAEQTLTGSATVAGGQCVVKLQITNNNNIGGGVTDTYDIYSLELSVAAVTMTMAQGSLSLTGQAVTLTLQRNYTIVLAQGTYTVSGQAMTFINPPWTRATKSTSVMTNSTKNSSSWSNSSKNSSVMSNASKASSTWSNTTKASSTFTNAAKS